MISTRELIYDLIKIASLRFSKAKEKTDRFFIILTKLKSLLSPSKLIIHIEKKMKILYT